MGKKEVVRIKKLDSAINVGEHLECEVERVYKLLEANTQRRVIIKNYEVDIFAEFATGPLKFSVIVECKDCKKGKKVSDQDMRSFTAKLLAARECGKAEKGVFVTTSTYTKTALSTANMHNIQCLTLEDLHNQIVDFRNYVDTALNEFSLSDLSDWYIEQTASIIEDYDSLTEEDKKKYLIKSLSDYTDNVFSKEKEKRLALLGNFGTGKTSFILKYRDDLLRCYLRDSSQRIPILINLRDFRSGIDIHQVITNHLQLLPGVKIDLKLCLELQRMGRFFFLLDGLDEMATKVDRTVINENLREIDRLYSENNNIYLLTCRTHFFQEKISDEFLKDYRVIYLVEWGRSELEQYLKKRFGATWNKYLIQITSTPNLEELSKTPLLLDMIAKSLSTIKEEGADKINSSKLYLAYTDEWIHKQSKRRGAVMSADQRRKFVQKLAVMLFLENRISIHFSELYEVAREFSALGDPTKLDYFDTDARTCTFITKDSNGNYGFRHRSFMEYFCAFYIADEINNGNSHTLETKLLPEEIIYFIGGMKIENKGIENLMKWSEIFEHRYLSENAVNILIKMNKPLSNKVKRHFKLIKTKFEMSLWRAITFDDEGEMNEFIKNYFLYLKNLVKRHMTFLDFYDYDVDDALQDVFLYLWTLRDKTKSKKLDLQIQNMPQLLNRTIKNILMDRYRLIKLERELPSKYFKDSLPDYYAHRKDDRIDEIGEEQLTEILKSLNLSEVTKRVFINYYLENKSIKEISRELKIRPKAVYPMLYRVKKIIQDKLFIK